MATAPTIGGYTTVINPVAFTPATVTASAVSAANQNLAIIKDLGVCAYIKDGVVPSLTQFIQGLPVLFQRQAQGMNYATSRLVSNQNEVATLSQNAVKVIEATAQQTSFQLQSMATSLHTLAQGTATSWTNSTAAVDAGNTQLITSVNQLLPSSELDYNTIAANGGNPFRVKQGVRSSNQEKYSEEQLIHAANTCASKCARIDTTKGVQFVMGKEYKIGSN